MNVEDVLPPPFEWIDIPGGEVLLEDATYADGTTGRLYTIPSYRIAKYPITNAQFEVFVGAKNGYGRRKWWDYSEAAKESRKRKTRPDERAFPNDDHPRANVSWFEAIAFCRWLMAQIQPSPLPPLPQGEGKRASRGDEADISDVAKERYRAIASKAMVQVARDLRQRQTNAELVLWECLRNRRLAGLKFRRQHPVAQTNYVVDFLSYENRVVIEVDGGIHETQRDADAQRQSEIEVLGYRVLRFQNEQVTRDLENTLVTILNTVLSPTAAMTITLPTEQQWQRAAAGDTGWLYPWGDEFDSQKCNTYESEFKRTTPVTLYPSGASPYGVMDMAGNVCEWCLTRWGEDSSELSSDGEYFSDKRAKRGGIWNSDKSCAELAFRHWFFASDALDEFGFRIACCEAEKPSP